MSRMTGLLASGPEWFSFALILRLCMEDATKELLAYAKRCTQKLGTDRKVVSDTYRTKLRPGEFARLASCCDDQALVVSSLSAKNLLRVQILAYHADAWQTNGLRYRRGCIS